jgi:uncharacterized membrane protein YecN with MAPEG domain
MNVVAIWCVAALGFLLFGMGWPISGLRRQENRYFGFDADPTKPLYKLIRAHANTAEYAPFLAVLFLYLGAHNPARWVILTMVAATVCRYLFVVGVVAFPTMARPNPVRFVGAGGTYVCGLMLSYALLV